MKPLELAAGRTGSIAFWALLAASFALDLLGHTPASTIAAALALSVIGYRLGVSYGERRARTKMPANLRDVPDFAGRHEGEPTLGDWLGHERARRRP